MRNLDKLQAKAKECLVAPSQEFGKFLVYSPSGSVYEATQNSCNCRYGQNKADKNLPCICSHTLAVFWHNQKMNGSTDFELITTQQARGHHKVIFACDGVACIG